MTMAAVPFVDKCIRQLRAADGSGWQHMDGSTWTTEVPAVATIASIRRIAAQRRGRQYLHHAQQAETDRPHCGAALVVHFGILHAHGILHAQPMDWV
eukprot:CAMPEP_0198136082 /NCGR_PEP_ID=MMETSP1442-20131203/60925_1 /TAXON_ID= /ORGANISM="Craspedostauros australis, Strain CCMP3328" /LENGTH=96 /DNA_ID=CAMNT_0043797277 /DNA_START=70 /DNA_END=360 /DNA_ORIENTATION=-